jgi:hypothetical protein
MVRYISQEEWRVSSFRNIICSHRSGRHTFKSGYFQYAGGFEPRKAFDITAKVPGNDPHDPMFIIEAVKTKTA